MGIEQSLRIVPKGEIALLEFDLEGEKVNKLSSTVLARLKNVVDELNQSPYKAVILISRKKNIFVAGADIEEIKKITTREEYLRLLAQAHEIFNAFEDLKMPTIAAIHGPCVGGGCEWVLTCDYRIATDDKSTKIGLPEVKLGIIPGFGGCVRLPRTVGLQASLDVIMAGKTLASAKAKKIGLVDEVVPATDLEARAMAMAQEVVSGKRGARKKRFHSKGMMGGFMESAMGRAIVAKQARKMTLSQTKGFYPAPIKALEVVCKAYGKKRDAALKIEMEGFADVAATDVSKNLIHVFYLMESVKKKSGVANANVKGRDVKNLAVLGAGTMGGGIAYVAADCGVAVRMKDINNQAIAIGLKSARDLWQKSLERRYIDRFEMEQKLSLVSGGLDFSGFDKMDVVVEAIVEDMEIKKKVIGETAKHCRADAIIATNTSSLSVTEMSKGHPNPENFVGMHFFNPVNKMPLVEVIRGEKTSDEAVVTIFELSKKMGKTPVVVKDGPGFLVNRLLLPWMAEAMFFLQEGMSVEVTDRYFTHKFGMPMGPFRLLDEVGLDVAVKVLKIFKASLGERVEIPQVAEKILPTGRLGRKNGKGFYTYDSRGKELGVDQKIYQDLGLQPPTNPLSEKVILERGMFAMVNEAAAALQEDRIVETPGEVDLAMIMGTGFPPFRGGLLRYADELGSQYIAQELEEYATKYGRRLRPTPPLAQMAKTNRKFY